MTKTCEVDLILDSPLWETRDESTLHACLQTSIDFACAQISDTFHRDAQVSILLCDNAQMQTLNKQWRGKDKPTNVLSFPSDPTLRHLSPILGDIVLAYETVQQEAANEGRPFEHHLSHLVIHGFLHLLGYDHETPQEALAMEAIEVKILEKMNIGNPYLTTRDDDE